MKDQELHVGDIISVRLPESRLPEEIILLSIGQKRESGLPVTYLTRDDLEQGILRLWNSTLGSGRGKSELLDVLSHIDVTKPLLQSVEQVLPKQPAIVISDSHVEFKFLQYSIFEEDGEIVHWSSVDFFPENEKLLLATLFPSVPVPESDDALISYAISRRSSYSASGELEAHRYYVSVRGDGVPGSDELETWLFTDAHGRTTEPAENKRLSLADSNLQDIRDLFREIKLEAKRRCRECGEPFKLGLELSYCGISNQYDEKKEEEMER